MSQRVQRVHSSLSFGLPVSSQHSSNQRRTFSCSSKYALASSGLFQVDSIRPAATPNSPGYPMRGSPEPLLSIPRSGYCSSSPPESDAGNRSAPIAVECPQGFRSVQNHQRTPVLVFIKASEQRTGSTERLSDPADISAVSRDLGRISEWINRACSAMAGSASCPDGTQI